VKNLDPDRIRKIVVRGTNWVGDAVMSVPALREIRRVFCRSHITLVVKPWVRDVYSSVDFVDEVLPFDTAGAHRGAIGRLRIARELRNRQFDLAILLQNAFDAALIAWLSGIPRRLGYARDGRSLLLTHRCRVDPEVRRRHQVYYYLDLLSGCGLLPPRLWHQEEYVPSIAIGVDPHHREAARVLLGESGKAETEELIGLNPGAAYGPAKRWLTERYAAVADHFASKYGFRVAIFGAAGEVRIAEEIAGLMKSRPLILAGRTTLGQLMALIKECRLLITNDSGPMHLAAALQVAQVAIFGSTSETATGPLDPRSRVVKSQAECSPCFLRKCPIDFRCMTGIQVDQVIETAERVLQTGNFSILNDI